MAKKELKEILNKLTDEEKQELFNENSKKLMENKIKRATEILDNARKQIQLECGLDVQPVITFIPLQVR